MFFFLYYMNLLDVHAHMDIEPLLEHIDEVLDRARKAGVTAIVANALHPQSNRKVLELATKYDLIKPALGFYPSHTVEVSEEEFDKEITFIRKQKPIAIGEVGMDFKFTMKDYALGGPITEDEKEQKVIQKKCFGKLIDLALELDVPLIVHSRKAELEVIELLEEKKAKKVIMHCFMGKKKLVERIRKNAWTFSMPVILLKLQQFQDIVKDTPLGQLLTETDSPYLGLEPGLRNEPANVALTIKKIAEIKRMNEQEVADQIFMNYQRLFL